MPTCIVSLRLMSGKVNLWPPFSLMVAPPCACTLGSMLVWGNESKKLSRAFSLIREIIRIFLACFLFSVLYKIDPLYFIVCFIGEPPGSNQSSLVSISGSGPIGPLSLFGDVCKVPYTLLILFKTTWLNWSVLFSPPIWYLMYFVTLCRFFFSKSRLANICITSVSAAWLHIVSSITGVGLKD